MSAEVHISPSPTDESVLLINESPVSRRGFLYLAGGLVSAAALGACGNDRDGYVRSAEPAGAGGGVDAFPSPEAAAPSPYTDSTPKPSPTETYESEPVEVSGYKLDELTRIKWESLQDAELASAIRQPETGMPAEVLKDPRAVSPDVNTYKRAMVLGVPAAAAKNRTVRLALVVKETDYPFSNRISSVVLPKGMVRAKGQNVELMPEPTTDNKVHPYRLRRGLYHMNVVFMVSPDPNRSLKEWDIVLPYVLNASVILENATYANAHIL